MAVMAIGAVFAGVGTAAGYGAAMAMVGTALTVVGAVTKNKDLMALGGGFGVGTLAGGIYNAATSTATESAVQGAAEGVAGEAAQSGAKQGLVGGQMADVAKGSQGFNGVEPAVGLGGNAQPPAAALKNAAMSGAGDAAKESVVPKGFWGNLTPAQGQVIGGVLKGVGEGAAGYLGAKEEQKAKQGIINDQRRYASQIPVFASPTRKYNARVYQ